MKGMLWHLSEPKKTLSEQVITAAEHFKNKYEKVPKIVRVHLSQVNQFEPVDGLTIIGGSVQFNHILMFPEEEAADGVS